MPSVSTPPQYFPHRSYQDLQVHPDAPAEDVAAEFRGLRAAADAIVDWQPPLLTFKAIVGASLACNPGPHVTDVGITDGSTGALFANALVAPGEVDAMAT